METEVDVRNPNYVLVPGMYAEVDLSYGSPCDAMAIPVTAVTPDPESRSSSKTGKVLVVTADNRIEPRRVALGMETENTIEVKSGLRDGESCSHRNRTSLQPVRKLSRNQSAWQRSKKVNKVLNVSICH